MSTTARKGDQILAWLPTEMREIDAKLLVLKAERERLMTEQASGMLTKARKEAITLRLREIKSDIEIVNQQRRRSSDSLNSHYTTIVRQALGKPHSYIHQRILTEAASRAEGNPENIIDIFPDDMIDALANNRALAEQKMSAEAKVQAVRRELESAKLSMKGNLTAFEYDKRKAFNNLIDKLLRQI